MNKVEGSNSILIGSNLETKESNCLIMGDELNSIKINEAGEFIINGVTVHTDKTAGDGIRNALAESFNKNIGNGVSN